MDYSTLFRLKDGNCLFRAPCPPLAAQMAFLRHHPSLSQCCRISTPRSGREVERFLQTTAGAANWKGAGGDFFVLRFLARRN